MDIHSKRDEFSRSENPVTELWNKRGRQNAEDLPDQNQKEMEVSFILEHIERGGCVLDAGCGNGKASFELAKISKAVYGIDVSGDIIAKAKKLASDKLIFSNGDVTNLKFDNSFFDFVLSQRCLINLETHERQLVALREIRRVLKKGGKYLMLETSKQGIESLAGFRAMFNLGGIKVPWHNLPIDEEKIEDDIKGLFEVEKKIYFGTYFFISRLLHPLLVTPNEPRFDAEINQVAVRIAEKIPNFNNEMSQIVLYILKAV